MTKGETVAVVVVVAIVAAVGVGLAVHYHHTQPATSTGSKPAKTVTAGDLIAGLGGAAVAQAGKDLTSWAESGIKKLFG